jgi:hypothetical protein
MCRFTAGSLSRVKSNWGGAVLQFLQTDRHGEADWRFLWVAYFRCERTGSVSILHTFRFAHFSVFVLLEACLMSLSVLLTQYFAGGKIETNEMGRVCSAYGGG